MVIWEWVHFKEKLNRFKNKDKSKCAVSNKQTNLFDFSMDQITKLSQQFLLQVFLAVLPVNTNIQYWTDRSNTNDGLVSDPVSECVCVCVDMYLLRSPHICLDWLMISYMSFLSASCRLLFRSFFLCCLFFFSSSFVSFSFGLNPSFFTFLAPGPDLTQKRKYNFCFWRPSSNRKALRRSRTQN